MTEATSAARSILHALGVLMRKRELRVLFLCNAVLGLGSSFVMPFFSLFGTQEVGMSFVLFGAFTTVTTLSATLISTWLAAHSDRVQRRRPTLLLAAAAGTFGYAAYAYVRSVWLLFLVGSLIVGTASVAFSQLFAHARAMITKCGIPQPEVSLYINIFRMSIALTWTIGPALAARVLDTRGFHGLMLSTAALYAVLLLLIWAFVPEAETAGAVPTSARVSPWAVLSIPGILPWFLAFCCMFAAQTMAMMNLPLLVLHVLHGTSSQVGIVFSLAPLFELPLMLYLGFLATRVDPARIIRAAMFTAIVYYAGLALVTRTQQIYPLQALSAGIVAVITGIAITFFQNKLPALPSTATNLYSNAQRLGGTAGYLLFGGVATAYGHRGVYVVCSGLSLLGSVLAQFKQRRDVA